MNSYPLLRPILFKLDPEIAHTVTLKSLKIATQVGLSVCLSKPPADCDPAKVMGLSFPNRVGLAAGLDKNGDYIEALASLGFGFLEIGTVTPRPQPGNPKPRMFRITDAEAIINRMGFNNHGVDYLIERLKANCYQGILGINIGKNFDTPMENAVEDYLICMQKVYRYASYITVNVSSPNTKNLRELQEQDAMNRLLQCLKEEQSRLQNSWGKYVPLAVKIAPDLSHEQILNLAECFLRHNIDAVIATNTTISRNLEKGLAHSGESGGLSGAPLLDSSTETLALLKNALKSEIPVIGVGGILKPEDAVKKTAAGASLVQLYTGLIYRGPKLVSETAAALHEIN